MGENQEREMSLQSSEESVLSESVRVSGLVMKENKNRSLDLAVWKSLTNLSGFNGAMEVVVFLE